MSHYILIHGAWEESRAWDNVSAVIRARGHTVDAVDLPGHGANQRTIPQVTMAAYIDSVVGAIESLDHPVILVGHSMTGAVISQVAERIPSRIERLIYVAAFLLKDGDTVFEAMQSDAGNQLLPEIVFSDDQTYATVSEQTLRSVGFHDVDEAVIQRILPLMAEKQSTEPFMARIEVSDENFGSVPKSYIRTSIDKITSTDLQDRMISNWEVETVHHLESGHFPAFSVPGKLADILLQPAYAETAELAATV
jgi:pimeloyl-ACP methyl ester carboxylesterase